MANHRPRMVRDAVELRKLLAIPSVRISEDLDSVELELINGGLLQINADGSILTFLYCPPEIADKCRNI